MEKTINSEIISTALKYLGEEEILGNLGFKDSEFEVKMKSCGWKEKDAWCAYFAELIWKEAYQHWDATLFTRLDKLFTGSAVNTFKNFQKTKDFIATTKPVVGSLAVWQKYTDGKAHWTGHIGIVESFDIKNRELTTIDGNTNDKGSREGYIVARQLRPLDFTLKQNGLNLLGFIHPKQI